MLKTMPDMTWTVYVDRWMWIYKFTRKGLVSWRDPYNGKHGLGSWRIEKDKLVTRWNASKTREEWDLPIRRTSTGTCIMAAGTFDLSAVAQNFTLRPGDVVNVSGVKYVIYEDEIRSGGTVAWVCRNPGAIRQGDKFGAYPGKTYKTEKAGEFAIFPTEEIGAKAIIAFLKQYGRVTITTAMHNYAPKKDGKNDPDLYAARVAKAIGVPVTTYVTDLDDTQMDKFVKAISGQEHSKEGTRYDRDSESLPAEIQARLPPHLYPPTAEEIQNSSLMKTW